MPQQLHGIILLLHILSATIWTGGHLVLALSVLPRALRESSISDLMKFEASFERVGIPALIIQAVTGLLLAWKLVPNLTQWFAFENAVAGVIGIKLLLLILTIAFAADARLRIIPKMTEKDLTPLAWHIIPVTVLSVLFVVLGVSFRTGWFY